MNKILSAWSPSLSNVTISLLLCKAPPKASKHCLHFFLSCFLLSSSSSGFYNCTKAIFEGHQRAPHHQFSVLIFYLLGFFRSFHCNWKPLSSEFLPGLLGSKSKLREVSYFLLVCSKLTVKSINFSFVVCQESDDVHTSPAASLLPVLTHAI